jgi:uncharacterized protein with PIN domain
MKFLLENNLSRLAKWIRFLGYDVKVLEGPVNLEELMRNRDRVFITTSRRWERSLKNLGIRYLVVPREDWEVQLCMTLRAFGLEPDLKLSRCSYCGGGLIPVRKEDFKDRIPPRAYESAYDFTYCSRCDAVFWKGLHYERMVRMLRDVLRRCKGGQG